MRVTHVAVEANPFGSSRDKHGAPDHIARLVRQENLKGTDSCLLLPLVASTRQAIKQQRLGKLTLTEAFALPQPMSSAPSHARVHCLAPSDGMPTFFVEGDPLADIASPEELRRDLGKCTFFARAALEFIHQKELPQIVNCHDWPAALLLFELHYRQSYMLLNKPSAFKTILSIHNFSSLGQFLFMEACQAIAGLNIMPPDWARDNGGIIVLKGGINLAHLTCAPSLEQIVAITNGSFGQEISRTVRDQVANKRLVGLAENDSGFPLGRLLSNGEAAFLARQMLSAYRYKVVFDRPLIDSGPSTFPALEYPDPTPVELLSSYLPPPLHSSLSPAARERAIEMIEEGRGARLRHARSEADITLTHKFYDLEVTCDLESSLSRSVTEFIRACGLKEGEINRIFSIELPLDERARARLGAKFSGQDRVTLYEAMTAVEVLPTHLIGILEALDKIWRAGDQDETTAAEIAASLKLEADPTALRSFSLHLKDVIKELGLPFIISILLHDIGKYNAGADHPQTGWEILNRPELREPLLGLLLSEEQFELIRSLVLHHLTIGLFIELAYGDTTEMVDAWCSLCNKKPTKLARLNAYSLVLLNLADAHDRSGNYTQGDFERLQRIHSDLRLAENEAHLLARFAANKLKPFEQGRLRFGVLVMTEAQGADLARIDAELRGHYARNSITQSDLFAQLGSFNLFAPKRTVNCFASPFHRARFLIWLAELAKDQVREIVPLYSKDPAQQQKEIAYLTDLLERDDFAGFQQLVDDQTPGKRVINLRRFSQEGKI